MMNSSSRKGVAMESFHRAFLWAMAIFGTAVFSACGGSGGGGGTTQPPPISVSISPSASQKVDQGQSKSFTATVNNDSSNKGVNWSLSGSGCSGSACGTLANSSTSSVTYKAPSSGSASLTVTVAANSVADSSKSASDSITVAPPPLITTTSPLPSGAVNQPYSASLQATGGIQPYAFSLANGTQLPVGLSMDSNGNITGTPSSSGIFTFAAQVADSANPPLTKAVSLQITIKPPPPSISMTTLPARFVAVNGTASVAALVSSDPSNAGMDWSVSCNSASCGTITPHTASDAAATYTAPAAIPTGAFVTLNAVATASSNASTSATVDIVSSTNNGALSGHYAFLLSGYHLFSNRPVVVGGSFSADGAGKLSNGILDLNASSGATTNLSWTGIYSIGPDNRGSFNVNTPQGPFAVNFAIGSFSSGVATRGRVSESFLICSSSLCENGDSGVIEKQDTSAFNLASLNGNYAFGFQGGDMFGGRFASEGRFTADGSGNVSSGVEDANDGGMILANQTNFTGKLTAPDSTNGRGTLTMNVSGGGSAHASYYVVSASEVLVVSTDALTSSVPLYGGEALQQSGTFSNASLNAASVVFTTGSFSFSSDVRVGRVTADGKGNVTELFDENAASGIQTNASTSGTYSVSSNGRGTVNFPSFVSAFSAVIYLVRDNEGFVLGTDSSVPFGFFEPQSTSPFGSTISGSFALGTDPPCNSFVEDDFGAAVFNSTGKVTLTLDSVVQTQSGGVQTTLDETFTGTYAVAANGRGTATVSASGGSPLTLVFYMISPTKFVLLATADNGDMVPVLIHFEQ